MSSNAVTSSAALIELKNDLAQLSNSLHTIFDLMNADMKQVGSAWQDGKYEEFVSGYKPQINKCEEIAVRYTEWCQKVLDPTIENVIAVEKTDVVGNGGKTVGAVAGGAVAAVAVGVASGFNIGGINSSMATTKAVPISNGCGSEIDPKSFVFAELGREADVAIAVSQRPWRAFSESKSQTESCDLHDKCYYDGEDKGKCDIEFQQRSKVMGTAVRLAKKKSRKSYEAAQIDRETSQRLQSAWEEEHNQCLDAEKFRVDIEKGGASMV